MAGLSVLLTTEGTYPYHRGGVSTWCHALTQNLAEIDFTLFAVTMHPYLSLQYPLSRNVVRLIRVPLWGVEEPAEYAGHDGLAVFLRKKWATTETGIAANFLPSFKCFLTTILSPESSMQALGATLLEMYDYFGDFDYHLTMRALAIWEEFAGTVAAAFLEEAPGRRAPAMAELTEALRLLYRFLSVLHTRVPRTDLSHSAAAAFCGLPCVVARIRHGTPYLLTEHGVYIREQYLNLTRSIPSFFVRWFLYRLMGSFVRLNYHFADQISPVCAYNARWEKWWGVPPERIQVIYNGVDAESFRPIASPRGNRQVVSSIGLIYSLKGQLDLVEAAAIVRVEFPQVEFRFYGSVSDPSYYAKCRARIHDLGLQSTVIFSGATSDTRQVYCEADVVALASISEGFPYVVIEAMTTGAAIVSTDVGGVREALGETGLLVRPRRPQEMAEAILRLLRAPEERSRLGSQARARALRLFTQEKFLEEYRSSYQRLVGDRDRTGVVRFAPRAQAVAAGAESR